MQTLPPDHPERIGLAAEVHARPPVELHTPERATYIAVLVDAGERAREHAHVSGLCERFSVAPPAVGATHFTSRFGALQFKWERHSEFSSYTFFMPGSSPRPFSEPALGFVPEGWLAAVPGKTIVAAHAKLLQAGGEPPDATTLAEHFSGNIAVGAEVGDGAGFAYTDFRIHSDGCARFLVLNRHFTPAQAGRTLQRLFEIEAYRMMALLALPVARQQSPRISMVERSLATLTEKIASEDGGGEALLGQLTKLAAEVENALAMNQSRLSACGAYYELVRARIAELRERRLAGVQTIDEFMTRRLAPAVATVATVSRRLRDLSERVAQASGLLSTRVDIAREKQNQALLASMDRRARLQLRLQQAVEGLSIVAITYYVVGLVGYGAKAIKHTGMGVDPDIAIGIAIPIVALLAAFVLRRMRHKIAAADANGAL